MKKKKKKALIIKDFQIQIFSQSAEAGPPLGTILGNLGIQTSKFAKEFNDFTASLPSYYRLRVNILVKKDRGFVFSVLPPSTGELLALLRQEEATIKFTEIIKLALFQFPTLALEQSVPMVLSTAYSASIEIIK